MTVMLAVPEAATPFHAVESGTAEPGGCCSEKHIVAGSVIEPRPLNAQVKVAAVRRCATGQIATLTEAFGLQKVMARRAEFATMICDGEVVTWAS